MTTSFANLSACGGGAGLPEDYQEQAVLSKLYEALLAGVSPFTIQANYLSSTKNVEAFIKKAKKLKKKLKEIQQNPTVITK